MHRDALYGGANVRRAVRCVWCMVQVSLHWRALNACSQRAAVAHLGKSQVHQLRLALQQHDVVGLQVAVSISAKVLQFF